MKKIITIILMLFLVVGCSEQEDIKEYQVGEDKYILIKTTLQDGLSLKIPNTFVELDEDSKNFKYESDIERVFVDTKYSNDITFDYYDLDVSNTTIPEYKDIVVQTFNASDYQIEWLKNEVVQVGKYNVARLEFVIKANIEIYYNMAIMVINNQVLDITFNGVELPYSWDEMINDMFDSIEVTN